MTLVEITYNHRKVPQEGQILILNSVKNSKPNNRSFPPMPHSARLQNGDTKSSPLTLMKVHCDRGWNSFVNWKEQWEQQGIESTGWIHFSRSREQHYNAEFPGRESTDQRWKKKERGVQKDKTQLLATEKGGAGGGAFFNEPPVRISPRHEVGPLFSSLVIMTHLMDLLSIYGKQSRQRSWIRLFMMMLT